MTGPKRTLTAAVLKVRTWGLPVEEVSADRTVPMQRRPTDPFEQAMRDFWPGCRRHGPRCRIPWGYDPDHTDSDRPYTVDELATRTDGPHRFAYPDGDSYLRGWKLWLALRRDAAMNPAEHAVSWNVRLEEMAVRWSWKERSLEHLIEEFRR